MLKLFGDIYFRVGAIIGGIFFLFFCFVYLLLSPKIENNGLWILLFFIWVIVYFIIVFLLHYLHKKLDEDVAIMRNYLQKIDAKEYDAPISIKNSLEFLELSLLLKNLIKRLHARDKKQKKIFKK